MEYLSKLQSVQEVHDMRDVHMQRLHLWAMCVRRGQKGYGASNTFLLITP